MSPSTILLLVVKLRLKTGRRFIDLFARIEAVQVLGSLGGLPQKSFTQINFAHFDGAGIAVRDAITLGLKKFFNFLVDK